MSESITLQEAIDEEMGVKFNEEGQVTIEIIDPESGEIKVVEVGKIDHTERLIRLSEVIARARHEIVTSKNVKNVQMEIIQAEHKRIEEAKESTIGFLEQKCAETLAEMGERGLCNKDAQGRPTLKVHGVGKFGWMKQQPKVNTEGWDELSVEEQLEIASNFNGASEVPVFKTSVSGNKVHIKKILVAGDIDVVGFRLEPAAPDKFKLTVAK